MEFNIPKRILCLDVGDRSLGIAISDSFHTIAQGVDSIRFSSSSPEEKITCIQKLISTHKVGKIVVGMPVDLKGEEGGQAKKVREFTRILKEKINLPVVFADERFTTLKAERLLREGKVSLQKRREVKDKVAATIFLQDYLDASRKDK